MKYFLFGIGPPPFQLLLRRCDNIKCAWFGSSKVLYYRFLPTALPSSRGPPSRLLKLMRLSLCISVRVPNRSQYYNTSMSAVSYCFVFNAYFVIFCIQQLTLEKEELIQSFKNCPFFRQFDCNLFFILFLLGL